jgi:single-strand DNA-binding protein
MASVNLCIFIGNLTKDPEVRYMPNGEAVANVSIACNEQWKNKAGEKQESVEFVNLVFYKRLAEIAGEYLRKGASIYVEGKMKTRKWEKDGVTRYATEIIVNEMTMLGGKSDKPEQSQPASEPKPSQPTQGGKFDNFDDDIPFAPCGKSGADVSWRCM